LNNKGGKNQQNMKEIGVLRREVKLLEKENEEIRILREEIVMEV